MNNTEPYSSNIRKSKFSTFHRVLHWSIALCISLLLLTILLRMGWLNKYHLASILDHQLSMRGVQLSDSELITISKQIRQPMWRWHVWAGYTLTGLYAVRLLFTAIAGPQFGLPWHPHTTLRERIQSWSYIAFYLFIAASLFTGLLIEHGPQDWRKDIEAVHSLALWYLVTFICIHFFGLYLSAKKGEGNVRSMFFRK